MADQDFDLPSGAKHHVTIATFQDANALTKALLKSGIGIKLADNPMDMDVGILKDVVVSALTSEEVEKALFKCLERSTWNSAKVVPILFDDEPEARKDYYAMAVNVVKVNCLPFFEQALSALKTRLGQKKDASPASK